MGSKMGVHIHSLQAKFTRPDLPDQNMEFRDINLVYGLNESGKTAIVDFLLRCLFKGYRDFPQRLLEANGAVSVTGMGDDPMKITALNFQHGRRLEELWTNNGTSFPISMARLLVLRGSEAAITVGEAAGIGIKALRRIFGTTDVIEKITQKIPRVVQNASLDAGLIVGTSQGEIANRNNFQKDLRRLGEMMLRLDNEYSSSSIAMLQQQLAVAREKLAAMEQARRFRAWQYHLELERVLDKLSRLPPNLLENLQRNLDSFQARQSELKTRQAELETLRPYHEQLPWLNQAVDIYERLLQPRLDLLPRSVWLLLAGIALLASVLAAFLNYPLGTGLAALLCAGFVGLYLRLLQASSTSAQWQAEHQALQQEFERRFDRKLENFADLKSVQDEYRSKSERFQLLQEQVNTLQCSLDDLGQNIERDFQSLGEMPDPSLWSEVFRRLKNIADRLQESINGIKVELATLGVASEEYSNEPAMVDFDPQILRSLQREVDEAESALADETCRLDTLKQVITVETGWDFSTTWEVLIESLRQKRADILEKYQEITARIAAGILVNKELAFLRLREDELIRQGLQTPIISRCLRQITGCYSGFDLQGEEILLVGADEPRNLNVLSTGTHEQALLALRMGFASLLAGDQPLFLILDDAFQHTDWQRRPWLVESLSQVADSGWQVFYFSMDDHIRNLFEQKIKPAFGDRYARFDL